MVAVTFYSITDFHFSVPLARLCNSYIMVCPPVRGDNPQALASGLSYVQVDKDGITILYHLHQCRPCTLRDFGYKVGKGGIKNLYFMLSSLMSMKFQLLIKNKMLKINTFLAFKFSLC